jgi:hypothetical protein
MHALAPIGDVVVHPHRRLRVMKFLLRLQGRQDNLGLLSRLASNVRRNGELSAMNAAYDWRFVVNKSNVMRVLLDQLGMSVFCGAKLESKPNMCIKLSAQEQVFSAYEVKE